MNFIFIYDGTQKVLGEVFEANISTIREQKASSILQTSNYYIFLSLSDKDIDDV